jgi:hypothetical protein
MELLSHGIVPGFSYGRITYLYAFSDLIDDHTMITEEDLRYLKMPVWERVVAYRGSGNATFHEAESLLKSKVNTDMLNGTLWTNGSILMWKPKTPGENITLNIPVEKDSKVRITLTMANSPESGVIRVYFKDNRNDDNIFDLKSEFATNSRNQVLKPADLKHGTCELVIENMKSGTNYVGIDFIWVQY